MQAKPSWAIRLKADTTLNKNNPQGCLICGYNEQRFKFVAKKKHTTAVMVIKRVSSLFIVMFSSKKKND